MRENSPGKYIVIEGVDGAGKTTQKDLLQSHLISLGNDVVEAIEPGGTSMGLALRQIILDPDISRQPETELDLFTAARRELTHQIIGPAISDGKYVVGDRTWLSAVAYQGYGGGVDTETILERSKSALGDYFMPDSITILDVPLEITEERLRTGRNKADWFEKQGRPFFEKVREGYLWLAEEFDIAVIDGSPSVENVHESLLKHLGSLSLM